MIRKFTFDGKIYGMGVDLSKGKDKSIKVIIRKEKDGRLSVVETREISRE